MKKSPEPVFDFQELSPDEKRQYMDIALHAYGTPHALERGEPLYFNQDFSLNSIYIFVLDQMKVLNNKN